MEIAKALLVVENEVRNASTRYNLTKARMREREKKKEEKRQKRRRLIRVNREPTSALADFA